ncbi:MAG: DEAD/DEAH box helicase [Tepidisphaeraceae bacterium]
MSDLQSADMLFPSAAVPEAVVGPVHHDGPVAAVAIERSVDRTLDYAIPPKFVGTLAVGQRVKVPLGRGNKPAAGYVVSIADHSTHPRLKAILAIDDDRVLISPKMMELARWIGRYYVSPLGMVLETIIPSAVKKRIGMGYTRMVRLAKSPEEIQAALEATKSKKRRTLLSRLLQLKPGEAIALHTLAFEAETSIPTAAKLKKDSFVDITEEADLASLETAGVVPTPAAAALALNDDQAAAVEAVGTRLDRFNVNLLFGVTGSGKTEVYLQTIDKVVKAGRQAIVLVPEIALTPQTVRRFVERFSPIAVLHSALTNTERHQNWQRISSGQAKVIVGARSAIFAPTKNLGLIVVDEEHEGSYKQDQVPRYNARDVAIKRRSWKASPSSSAAPRRAWRPGRTCYRPRKRRPPLP